MGGSCPNCGHGLAMFRTDRQRAGQREVLLTWTICQKCRHVGLHAWRFVEEERSSTVHASERQGERKRRIVPLRRFA